MRLYLIKISFYICDLISYLALTWQILNEQLNLSTKTAAKPPTLIERTIEHSGTVEAENGKIKLRERDGLF